MLDLVLPFCCAGPEIELEWSGLAASAFWLALGKLILRKGFIFQYLLVVLSFLFKTLSFLHNNRFRYDICICVYNLFLITFTPSTLSFPLSDSLPRDRNHLTDWGREWMSYTFGQHFTIVEINGTKIDPQVFTGALTAYGMHCGSHSSKQRPLKGTWEHG